MGCLHDHRGVVFHGFEPVEHRHAIEIGHHEIENHHIDLRQSAVIEPVKRLRSPFHHFRRIAKTAHHFGEQAALDRIVVDDEEMGAHGRGVHFRLPPTRMRAGHPECSVLSQCRQTV